MSERFGARLVGGLALVADPSRGIGHRRLDQLDRLIPGPLHRQPKVALVPARP